MMPINRKTLISTLVLTSLMSAAQAATVNLDHIFVNFDEAPFGGPTVTDDFTTTDLDSSSRWTSTGGLSNTIGSGQFAEFTDTNAVPLTGSSNTIGYDASFNTDTIFGTLTFDYIAVWQRPTTDVEIGFDIYAPGQAAIDFGEIRLISNGGSFSSTFSDENGNVSSSSGLALGDFFGLAFEFDDATNVLNAFIALDLGATPGGPFDTDITSLNWTSIGSSSINAVTPRIEVSATFPATTAVSLPHTLSILLFGLGFLARYRMKHIRS